MRNVGHLKTWVESQKAFERRGALLFIISVAAISTLAVLAEHHEQPVLESGYYGDKGLLDIISYLRVPLWNSREGRPLYLPYEYVFAIGIFVASMGIALVVMGARPDEPTEQGSHLGCAPGSGHDC